MQIRDSRVSITDHQTVLIISALVWQTWRRSLLTMGMNVCASAVCTKRMYEALVHSTIPISDVIMEVFASF
jgi:hypothetical protein